MENSDGEFENIVINIEDTQDQPKLEQGSDEKISIKDKTYKSAFIITLPVFIGYACCFSLQKKLSYVFGLTDGVTGTKLSVIYGIGTSFVYFFNLIFRVLGHNIFFGFLHPRDRVLAALSSLMIGMSLLAYFSLQKTTQNVIWVFISYSFVGVCEGSFGPNMLNVVHNLGMTRIYVLLAMPSGCACITILAFVLMTFGVPYQAFYIVSIVVCIISITLYLFTIYPASKNIEMNTESHQEKFDLISFCHDLKEINQWFPKIGYHCICFIFNNIFISLFNPGCTLFAYSNRVTLRLIGSTTIMNEIFIFVFNTGSFLGDFFSRKVMNQKRIVNPIVFTIMSILGVILNLSLIPEVAPLAAFLLMWANGGIYTQISMLIGLMFHEKYHLTATSSWLFLGDFGSMIGSNLIQPILPFISLLKSKMY